MPTVCQPKHDGDQSKPRIRNQQVTCDTIYSLGVFYAPKGTIVTLPASKDDRYQSAMILQNDHYIDQVFYGAGPHEIVAETEFVGIAIRTAVDPSDPEDVRYVNSLQDQINVTWPKGTKVKSFKPGNSDVASLDARSTSRMTTG